MLLETAAWLYKRLRQSAAPAAAGEMLEIICFQYSLKPLIINPVLQKRSIPV